MTIIRGATGLTLQPTVNAVSDPPTDVELVASLQADGQVCLAVSATTVYLAYRDGVIIRYVNLANVAAGGGG